MRRCGSALLAWLVFPAFLVTLQAAEPAVELSVVTDRPEAIYSIGEQARFVVTLKKEQQPLDGVELTYALDKDGMPPTREGKLKVVQGSASLEGTLSEPGFLQCRVTYRAAGQEPITMAAGAGFDPLKIAPSLPVPDDFDAFWAAQKARLAAVPLEAKLTPMKSTIDQVECFDVQVACVPPKPVSGYFARPVGAAPKSLPAIISFHGSGVRNANLDGVIGSASRYHALAMEVNAHGIPNGMPESFYTKLRGGELKGYAQFGKDQRETSYFLGMFLRVIRSIDFITSQPEWDGRIVIVRGTSQGGGQAIAAAGLDPRVTLVSAVVPALCDHSGSVIGRNSGWPKFVRAGEEKSEQVLQVARYFDCMNFATRAKADAIFGVGYIDTTCPPTSVYSAYNNYAGKKQIVAHPLMTHRSWPAFGDASAAAIEAHIKSVHDVAQ